MSAFCTSTPWSRKRSDCVPMPIVASCQTFIVPPPTPGDVTQERSWSSAPEHANTSSLRQIRPFLHHSAAESRFADAAKRTEPVRMSSDHPKQRSVTGVSPGIRRPLPRVICEPAAIQGFRVHALARPTSNTPRLGWDSIEFSRRRFRPAVSGAAMEGQRFVFHTAGKVSTGDSP